MAGLLRLQTSGWSGEKLFDAGLLLVLGWHALGYAWPAMRRRQWQSAIPAVNRSGACLFLVTLVLLLSPLADAAA
jgi:nitrate reductase gamma subunit